MNTYTKNNKKREDLINKKDVLLTKIEDIEEQINDLNRLSEKRSNFHECLREIVNCFGSSTEIEGIDDDALDNYIFDGGDFDDCIKVTDNIRGG